METNDGARARILEAAINVIENDGEAGLRTKDIAAHAGITEPTIYHYFGNRDGLVTAAQLERYVRGLRDTNDVVSKFMPTVTSREELAASVMEALRFLGDPSRTALRRARASALGSAINRPELLSQIAEATVAADRELAVQVAEAQRRGWVRAGLDPMAVAAWIHHNAASPRIYLEISPGQYHEAAYDALVAASVLWVVGLSEFLPPAIDPFAADRVPGA